MARRVPATLALWMGGALAVLVALAVAFLGDGPVRFLWLMAVVPAGVALETAATSRSDTFYE